MKTAALLIGALALTGIALFMQQGPSTLQAEYDSDYQLFQSWKLKHQKTYTNDEVRFEIFKSNLRLIEHSNSQGKNYKLAINKFGDLTNQEYQQRYLSTITSSGKKATELPVENPEEIRKSGKTVNWVEEGAVTGIKDQGICGSCWAFSAVASLEGAYQITSGNLTDLSNQQVTACTPYPYGYGCGGGNPASAFDYTKDAGVEPASKYPYEQLNNATTEPCRYYEGWTVYQNKGGETIPCGERQSMMIQIQKQPISVAVDSASYAFQFYDEGILDQDCGNGINHAIAAVGYNAEEEYWTCKNSWGLDWGNKGYIKIKNIEGYGVCGINMDASFPTF